MIQQNSSDKPPVFGPFVGLFMSVILPIMILNQVPKRLPEFAHEIGNWGILAIALFFPIAHGLYELITQKKFGVLPILGLLNVLGTGGLAAFGAEGIWFAVKEAFFPALIGAFVLASAFTAKPLANAIFLNESFMQRENVDNAIAINGARNEFDHEMKKVTLLFAVSFFVSAALNFGLAVFIFTPIALDLAPESRSALLNEQVARMTWMGFVVIAVPSFVCTALLFNHIIKNIKRLTGLKDEQIFRV